MPEHPAVEFLTAAWARAEEMARAATPGPWEARLGDPRGDLVCSAHDGEYGDLIGSTVARVLASVRGGYDRDPGSLTANMQMIATFADPAAVLRRVAAERQILARHALVNTAGYDGYGAASFDACQICGRAGYTPGPCRTVLLLAQAWGWTEEAG